MKGTLNGFRLRNVTALEATHPDPWTTLTSIRVTELGAEFEQALRLGGAAILVLNNETIKGTITQYSASRHSGYEITIQHPT